MLKKINRRWMLEGVTMVDPSRTYIDATVAIVTKPSPFTSG